MRLVDRSALLTLLVVLAPSVLASSQRSEAQRGLEILPAPSGPHAVGTTVAYLLDRSRTDVDLPDGRPITLQLWYPSNQRSGPRAPYLYEPALGDLLTRQSYYGMPPETIAGWRRLVTHAAVDAAPAGRALPLVALSVGLGVARAHYTVLAEELASHGYAVAMVESPLQGTMLWENRREVSDTAGRLDGAEAFQRAVTAWAEDIRWVFARMRDRSVSAAVDQVAAAVDWTRLGAIGHSIGGLAATATCEIESTLRACVNMDGGLVTPEDEPLASFVERGVTKPVLMLRSQPLYDDTTLARRGMTRAQWEQRGRAGTRAFATLVARSVGPVSIVQVAGTGHFSFSDAPWVMPTAITRFGGRIIQPARGHVVISAVLRAFLDQALLGRGAGVTGLATQYPELTVTESAASPRPTG